MNLNELRAKRDTYLNTMRNMIANAETEKRALTPAEQKDLDGLKEKVTGVAATLDRA